MPSFSTIVQNPAVRAVVQQGLLTREFKDALFPRLLYRGEAIPAEFPTHVGDSLFFTGKGLLPRNVAPIVPGVDPVPQTYPVEQWQTQIQKYAGTIDTDMPTDIAAIVKLFMENTKQLGLQAALSLNTGARDQAFNAAMSGWTVTSSATGSGGTSVPVQRLNGLTRARRPDLAAGSAVAYNPVSASNPLPVTIMNVATPQAVNITGFTPQTPGDEIGPGSITVDGAVTFQSRSAVFTSDRTSLIRATAGNSIDALSSGSIFTPSLVRAAVARLRTMNVPTFSGSGYYHCHLDPTSETQLYADQEFQRLNASIPDYVLYKELALGTMQGTVFFTDTENPLPSTVLTVNSDGLTFTVADPFGGELYTTGATSGVVVHRALWMGQGGLQEYGQNQDELLTMAGITGKVGDFDISNNGIEVSVDGVKLILRAPQNRTQDVVASTWMWLGSWTFRTDATTGDAARFKRALVVEHA